MGRGFAGLDVCGGFEEGGFVGEFDFEDVRVHYGVEVDVVEEGGEGGDVGHGWSCC